jgi:hypothetical protein
MVKQDSCFQRQRDFNYLELRYLSEGAKVGSDGVRLAGMHYHAVILDGLSTVLAKALPALRKLAVNGRLIVWNSSPPGVAGLKGSRLVKSPDDLVQAIEGRIKPDLTLVPASQNIRYRHVIKGREHFYMLFNEESEAVTVRIDVTVKGRRKWLDPFAAESSRASADEPVVFQPHKMKLLHVASGR